MRSSLRNRFGSGGDGLAFRSWAAAPAAADLMTTAILGPVSWTVHEVESQGGEHAVLREALLVRPSHQVAFVLRQEGRGTRPMSRQAGRGRFHDPSKDCPGRPKRSFRLHFVRALVRVGPGLPRQPYPAPFEVNVWPTCRHECTVRPIAGTRRQASQRSGGRRYRMRHDETTVRTGRTRRRIGHRKTPSREAGCRPDRWPVRLAEPGVLATTLLYLYSW